ncbi:MULTISPECIES: ATP-binding cassette domain-containing protein [Paenibacillus]|uniref:Nickel ABC transporter ATP-binding protein n=3 Tax=Paenibacillus TaxID=44249 RepID=A0ABX2ZEM7_PAEPO|nr:MULTISPECIES: ATP-binding cassette domain-containing protein [Paenibacillus]MCP3745526.1 ATP-binding cassette domain-containing protein [Paenibacillus sp. A3M_27_13]MDR6778505.1 ABC-type dipeptide/oligopeptide/nickel transport system ATPase component [Paenibacillus peoriae]ODA09970.1 nickel ABC transporter ATP-binding protein [Paenibacillus polymyxa]ODB57853.1 nickel ABC transporter ATP-binding protein [Paenibacillus polymyxa]OME73700.1 nickel ABC transporter ATP-binding protein [Paenibacil
MGDQIALGGKDTIEQVAGRKPLLHVEHLEICRTGVGASGSGSKPLLRDVSFSIYSGEIVALTGPSGCGKSLTAHAIAGMLEPGIGVTQGRIYYNGEDTLPFQERRWQRLRREDIALLIQQSLSGLNPIRTVRAQLMDTLRLHGRRRMPHDQMEPGQAGAAPSHTAPQQVHPLGVLPRMRQMLIRAMEIARGGATPVREAYLRSLLRKVGFADPEHILSSYPFELSGGMCQRVLLAAMLSSGPSLFIADEPTTALDVINRDKVLALLQQLREDFDLTILLISHDRQGMSRIADRVLEMSPEGRMHQ